VAARADLLRLVCDADGRVAADPARRAAGRGLNVHRTAGCLRRAVEPRVLARAFRRPGPFDTTGLAGLSEGLATHPDAPERQRS